MTLPRSAPASNAASPSKAIPTSRPAIIWRPTRSRKGSGRSSISPLPLAGGGGPPNGGVGEGPAKREVRVFFSLLRQNVEEEDPHPASPASGRGVSRNDGTPD